MTLLLLAALAVASYQLGRLVQEYQHVSALLPPATRGAIRRDRRRSRLGLAGLRKERARG